MGTLKLGPDGFDKIALLGTAPGSIGLAPFDDPTWAIWVCSPGAFPTAAQKRSDVYFETHRFQPSAPGKFGAPGTRPWFSPEFHQFLKTHKGPVFMSAVDPTIPNSVRIPFEPLIEKYGPYFFSSSLSWMLAMAIEQSPKAIGMWGVDMSSTEEYSYQRPACQHFLGMAKALGIEVIIPVESDLMRPPIIYGYDEVNPRYIKIQSRLEMFHQQRGAARNQIEQTKIHDAYLSGAIDDATYMLNTWAADLTPEISNAMSYSERFLGKPLQKNPDPQVPLTDVVEVSVLDSTGADVRKLVQG